MIVKCTIKIRYENTILNIAYHQIVKIHLVKKRNDLKNARLQ